MGNLFWIVMFALLMVVMWSYDKNDSWLTWLAENEFGLIFGFVGIVIVLHVIATVVDFIRNAAKRLSKKNTEK